MIKANELILRPEHFGYTLFDKKRLKHKFVKKGDLDTGQKYIMLEPDLSIAKTGILYSPIRTYFDLTSKCNIRCKTCYNKSAFKKDDELSTDSVIKAIEGLAKDCVFDVRFSGGELTQREDWHKILKRAKDVGLAVSMNTNGIFGEDVAEQLASLDLEQIAVSIDGDERLHDYIRGQGNHSKTIQSLKNLHKLGATLRINSIVTYDSLDCVESMLDLAEKYVSEINFFYFKPIGRAKEKLMHKIADYHRMAEIDEKIDELKGNYRNINILHRAEVISNNSIKHEYHNEFGLFTGSTDGFTRFNILQNGDLSAGGYSTYLDKGLKLGNIVDENYSLLDVWHNSERLNDFRHFSREIVELCGNCEEKGKTCGGEGTEMTLYRMLEGTNPYCKYSGQGEAQCQIN